MRIKFWQSLSAALAMAVIATPAFAGTIIVDDSFDDDSAAITGTAAHLVLSLGLRGVRSTAFSQHKLWQLLVIPSRLM